MTQSLRVLNAGNKGAFTLDGTRTHIVGVDEVALIDPGPDVQEHVRALSREVQDASRVAIVLSHGHGDHAGALASLVAALRGNGLSAVEVLGPVGIEGVERPLADGDAVETDAGRLISVHTPGHSRDHLCFHWPARRALFAGDMLLGEGDTTWVAEYPGCVADYLASIERLRRLRLDVVYPAHGRPLEDPGAALDRFESHRRARIAQVRRALESEPDLDLDTMLTVVYGRSVPEAMKSAARRSLGALVEHVQSEYRRA